MYRYKAIITDVYDGDTVTADIDLGFGIWMRDQKLRLHRINAPEVRGPQRNEGLKSRDWLRNEVLDKHVKIETRKSQDKGKYGRWLVTIWHEGLNVNLEIVRQGFAEIKEYE